VCAQMTIFNGSLRIFAVLLLVSLIVLLSTHEPLVDYISSGSGPTYFLSGRPAESSAVACNSTGFREREETPASPPGEETWDRRALVEDYVFRQPTPSTMNDCAFRNSQELVKRWKAQGRPYCSPDSSRGGLQGVLPSVIRGPTAGDGRPTTDITCFRLSEGVVENICDVRNFAVNLEGVLESGNRKEGEACQHLPDRSQ
jgi:hypothetical protein